MFLHDALRARGEAGATRPRMLPPETPLAMPEQDLAVVPRVALRPASAPQGMAERRAFMIAGALLIGVIGAQALATPMIADGMDPIDAGFFLLFLGLFGWIAFGFLNAIAGFCVLLATGPGLSPELARARLPERRTAVLLPVYNENVDAVFARLAAMTASIERLGVGHLFAFFVLSDSDAVAEPAERAAWAQLAASRSVAVHYRRRRKNVARKPGNIADWVRRFGGGFEHMIVLDADSLMSGVAMSRLAALIEANPGVGLIQTIPEIREARTPFARWQRFAASLYGPVSSAGAIWWSGSEATFWGHNAIVRVHAFAESCGLPELSGPAPFGGHVMSHDMVEAALLRRRGWAVHMLSLPDGSYEEFPPTLIDHAVRDRRWAQGNIQHLRLLATRGFHWISRLQLLMGASAYLTSPLWLLLMIGGMIGSMRISATGAAPPSWLLPLTALLLLGPKLAALAWAALDDGLRRSLGGWRALLAGVLVEIPLSVLVAPVTMLTQTLSIIDIVRGRPSGWLPQRRSVDAIGWSEAIAACRWHVALGLIFGAAMVAGVPGAIWTLPAAIGLLLAPATMILTAHAGLGERMARSGLFCEAEPAPGGDEVGPLWRRLLAPSASRMVLQP